MSTRHGLAALAMAAAALGAGGALAQERIAIGTGGLFYVIGAGIAEVLNAHMDGSLRCSSRRR